MEVPLVSEISAFGLLSSALLAVDFSLSNVNPVDLALLSEVVEAPSEPNLNPEAVKTKFFKTQNLCSDFDHI